MGINSEFESKLNAFTKTQVDAYLDKISTQAVSEAKLLSPVKTGNLRESIHKIKVAIGEYMVGSPANYAAFVELGTRKMAPRSYIRLAIRNIFSRGGK